MMNSHWTTGLLTCGPFVLALAAWASQFWMWRRQKPGSMTLAALGIFSASASLAAWTFFYYDFRPPSNPPPWQDSEIFVIALLLLPVMVAMLFALGAVLRGAPKWLMAMVEIGSLPLLFLSCMAIGAV
jgi:hypothetical protein